MVRAGARNFLPLLPAFGAGGLAQAGSLRRHRFVPTETAMATSTPLPPRTPIPVPLYTRNSDDFRGLDDIVTVVGV